MTHRSRADRSARSLRRVAGLVLASLGLGAAVPASAAAILTTSGELDVVEQTAVLSLSDGVERVLLDLRAVGQVDAGAETILLVATPSTPTITAGSSAVLDAVAEASAPEVIVEERWWPDLESFGGRPEEVAARVATYPIAPDGIAIAEPEGADAWLTRFSEQGIQLTDQDIANIQRYANAGWTLSTVTLQVPAGTANGRPTPLEISFESERMVLPMVLSSANTQSLELTTYVLAAQRMDRSDPLRGNATLEFAGRVTPSAYPELSAWISPIGGSAMLTKWVQTFPIPSRITEDLTFDESIYGPFDAGTETRTVDRIILGLPAGIMLVAGGMLLVAVVGIVISQVLQRRYQH